MIELTPILAASEFDVIIGIIFLLFWAVAAIAGKLKGQNKAPPPQEPAGPPGETPFERMQREIAEQLRERHGDALPPRPAPPMRPAPPPLPPVLEQRPVARPPVRQQPPPRQPQRRQPKQRPVQVFADVPPPSPAPRVTFPAQAQLVSPAATRPTAIGADAIRRWLRPATLRQQFILTELFQPPMSMREERH